MRRAFTLIELLVTLAILSILAALLLPALGKARNSARRTVCLSQLRQQSVAWQLYLGDHGDHFPDRRDLKASLPGGYRPWSTWPPSDPRAGWAPAVLTHELGAAAVWSCPALTARAYADIRQTEQPAGLEANAPKVRYWMWRFDRQDDPVTLDNFWGRTPAESVIALREANNPNAGIPGGPADVELVVDIYFPATVASLPDALRGRTPHGKGRNRLMLDGSAAFIRDPRTPRE